MDDDFPEISVLSYEDTEFEITLFYLDIVNLGNLCTSTIAMNSNYSSIQNDREQYTYK